MVDHCNHDFFANYKAVGGKYDSAFELILNNSSVDDRSWRGNNEIVVKIIFHLENRLVSLGVDLETCYPLMICILDREIDRSFL